MSRCFPFPPPGYEKKAKIEHTDLPTKEKHKEKKCKKDKKDKERREGKEKKNKDKKRSKEKHSDKKDRKEEHKDKKDRDKDKDKNLNLDAKRIEGQPESNNGAKLGPNSVQNKISASTYEQDLARRIRYDDRSTESQICEKNIVTNQRRGELQGRMVDCSFNNQLEEKEKAKDKKEDGKKVNGQKNNAEVRSFRNAIGPGFSSTDQKRVQGIAKRVEKNDIGQQAEEEKNKFTEGYNKYSKHKDRDQEKKSRSKDENRDKEKEEKAKEVSETSKDQLKLKGSSLKLKHSSKGILNSCNTRPLDVLKTSSNNPASEGIVCKRKELEINGISHDNGNRPNKLPRPVSSSQQAMENGRKLEPCHIAVHPISEWQGSVKNHKGDTKEHKINGLMEVHVPQPMGFSSGSLSTKATASENGEASVKQQHPDSKYLNQILSVPALVAFSDLDDQEWLFSSDSALSKKKPKVRYPEIDKTEQKVWAEALQIESVDLTALPYVIPF